MQEASNGKGKRYFYFRAESGFPPSFFWSIEKIGYQAVSLETSHINAEKLQFPNQGFRNYGFYIFPAKLIIMCFFLPNYVPKNLELCTNCTIFLSKNFQFFNALSWQIFFGFTFSTKLSIFKVNLK